MSEEYEWFKVLEHWQPLRKIIPPKELADSEDPLFPLFRYLYNKTEKLYSKLPKRKNGENSFVHPINVVQILRKSRKSNDLVILCIGMLHDYVEEEVDVLKQNEKIENDQTGIKKLDTYETEVIRNLERELDKFCRENKLSPSIVKKMITAIKLLTKHKRHWYYKYISRIFNYKDLEAKEIAIQVKLADRTHNILSIECFSEEERLYQCFKNLFILNNTKKFLLDKYGKEVFYAKNANPTERLFNKCAKATYDGFLTICHLSFHKGIGKVKSMLQLAFKKFAFEKAGLGVVTEIDDREKHPLWLYQGIVRKLDARLHHEWKRYNGIKEKEIMYCKKFFVDYNFSDEQIQAVIDYKDAYAIKESIGRLLYLPNYFVARFLCSELTIKGRIKKKRHIPKTT